jgi:hypothetical protein
MWYKTLVMAILFALIDGMQDVQVDIYRKKRDEKAERYSKYWHVFNLIRNLCLILFFCSGWKEAVLCFAIFLFISDGIINLIRGLPVDYTGTKDNNLDTDQIWIWLKSLGINQYWAKGFVLLVALALPYINFTKIDLYIISLLKF